MSHPTLCAAIFLATRQNAPRLTRRFMFHFDYSPELIWSALTIIIFLLFTTGLRQTQNSPRVSLFFHMKATELFGSVTLLQGGTVLE